jgi:hypothetical protein
LKTEVGKLHNGQNFKTCITELEGTVLEMSETRWEPVTLGFPLPDGTWREKVVHPNMVVEIG